jgi:hypothetical protein
LRIVGASPLPSFLLAQVIFEPNLPYGYPNNSQIQSFYTYQPMKMEETECSETSAYKIQTPGNYPEENIHHAEHDERKKKKIGYVS